MAMTGQGQPRTFCRFTAQIYFRSGLVWTLTEDAPLRFSDVFTTAGEAIDVQCDHRARQTTGDDWPLSIDLRVHSFETECTE